MYTDFSKAFDMVNHGILLKKLSRYGVRSKALGWLRSYLSNRQLRVPVNGFLSNEFDVISGVPQGSHLGPVLFRIFLNNISDLKLDYQLYADDMKIYREVSSERDQCISQQDIDEFGI